MKENLYIEQLELGGMANFSYIIGDKKTKEAAVVDPNDDTEAIEQSVSRAGLAIKSVLLTHGHYDHTGGLAFYSDRKGLPVFLSASEFPAYVPRCKTLQRFSDGHIIHIGEIEVKCLNTPGHTPGCVCFLVDGNLFTGDTLFIEAIGRTDLPGGSSSTIYESLQLIKKLPPSTMIWPGHNYGSPSHQNLQELIRSNMFLSCGDLEEFLDLTG